MKKKLKCLIGNILYLFPRSIAHRIYYFIVTGKLLKLSGKMNFNDKVHFMSIYEYGKYETDNSDKYKVRNFVKKKGLSDILVPIYNVYDNAEQIDFEKLPSKCVIKTNSGSGDVIIYENNKYDIKKLKKQLNKNLKLNYAKVSLEYHYENINSKIICEHFLDDKKHNLPLDYKFFCFNGKPLYVGVYQNRDTQLKRTFYDMDWNKQDILKKDKGKDFEKPKNFNKMIEIAKILSDKRKFVRVDLYNIDGKIYFGELTYSPSGGCYKCFTEKCLYEMGELIKLRKKD